MKLFIFSAFEPIPPDNISPLRYGFIAEIFAANGHNVTFITSSFFHLTKTERNDTGIWGKPNIDLKLIKSPTYKNHAGLKRFFSYFILGRNLKAYIKYLDKKDLPDLIISANPPVYANHVLAKWAERKNIPHIIDIQDVWPHNFKQLLPFKRLSGLVLKPLEKQFEYCLKNAAAVSAVSDDYLRFASLNQLKKTFYLGADTLAFGESKTDISDSFKMLYIGNASTNKLLFEAAKAIGKIKNVSLEIIGLREYSANFEDFLAKNNFTNVKVIPWLEQNELRKKTSEFDAALLLVNPDSLISFPYKAFTYFAAGLPVISNIRGGETEKLIAENKLGITIKEDSEKAITKAAYTLMQKNTSTQRQQIQQFARQNFDVQSIYEQYYIWAMQVFNGNV